MTSCHDLQNHSPINMSLCDKGSRKLPNLQLVMELKLQFQHTCALTIHRNYLSCAFTG